MKISVRLLAVVMCTGSCDVMASDPSGLAMVLAGLLFVVTVVAVGVTWFASLFLSGIGRLFLRWLPVAILWAPIPNAAAGSLYPAAFAFLDYRNLEYSEVLVLFVSEVVSILLLLVLCWHLNRKSKLRGDKWSGKGDL